MTNTPTRRVDLLMPNAETIVKRAIEKLDRADDEGRDLTPRERGEIEAQLEQAEGRHRIESQIKALDGEAITEHGLHGSDIGAKSLGEQFTESAGYKSIMDAAARGESWSSGVVHLDTKATLTSTPGTALTPATYLPGAMETLAQPLTVADLLSQEQTTGAQIRFVKEKVAENKAAATKEAEANESGSDVTRRARGRTSRVLHRRRRFWLSRGIGRCVCGADWSRDQSRPCDDETEREHPPGDLKRPDADRVTEDQDAADDCDQVGRNRGERDHLNARPQLQSAGRGIEGTYRGDQGRPGPRADQLEHPVLNRVRQEFDRDVRNAEQRPGGSAEEQTLRRGRDTMVGRDHGDRGAGDNNAALDRDQRSQGVARGIGVVRPRGQPDDRKPRRRDDHASPLAASELEAEEALGEDGEEHQPAREDGLHNRQWRQGERADVKQPRADRHNPADREPPGAEEIDRASQRVADPHGRRQDCAAVLEQKRDARRHRAGEGEGESDNHAGDRPLEARTPFTK
jgi:hypothetical protein